MGFFSDFFGKFTGRRSSGDADALPPAPPGDLLFSQLDSTESFDDHLRLEPDEWVKTFAINTTVSGGAGLPPVDAGDDEVYEAGERLSELRETIENPEDGVYCPVCHIANTQASRLRTPCPQCGRPLLKFGWD